jgi:peptidoglycan/LPS O-acetylase OafA/YrhL
MGCCLALLERVRASAFSIFNATRLRSDLALLGAVGALLLWTGLQVSYFKNRIWGLDSTVVSLLSAVVICSQIGKASGLGGSVLSATPLVFVGRISYGVYLWQGLFLGLPEGALALFHRFPIGLAATFTAALLSYVILERPLLKYKDRAFHSRPFPPPTQPIADALHVTPAGNQCFASLE